MVQKNINIVQSAQVGMLGISNGSYNNDLWVYDWNKIS